jgi:hypothetical protein
MKRYYLSPSAEKNVDVYKRIFMCCAQSTNLTLERHSWTHATLRNLSLGQDLAYPGLVAPQPMQIYHSI